MNSGNRYGVDVAKVWGRRCKGMGSMLQGQIGGLAANVGMSVTYGDMATREFRP